MATVNEAPQKHIDRARSYGVFAYIPLMVTFLCGMMALGHLELRNAEPTLAIILSKRQQYVHEMSAEHSHFLTVERLDGNGTFEMDAYPRTYDDREVGDRIMISVPGGRNGDAVEYAFAQSPLLFYFFAATGIPAALLSVMGLVSFARWHLATTPAEREEERRRSFAAHQLAMARPSLFESSG